MSYFLLGVVVGLVLGLWRMYNVAEKEIDRLNARILKLKRK